MEVNIGHIWSYVSLPDECPIQRLKVHEHREKNLKSWSWTVVPEEKPVIIRDLQPSLKK